MFVFIGLVLAIYGSVNYYIVRRVWQALSGHSLLRIVFMTAVLFLIVCYPVGRILERAAKNHVTVFLIVTGAFYLAVIVYAFFLILIIDLFRWLDKPFHFFPGFMARYAQAASFAAFWIVLVLIAGTIFGGWINAARVHIRNVDLTIAKQGGRFKELTIVHVSDIHFGTVLGRRRLERIVEAINNCRPDIVFFGGDTLDEDITTQKAEELSSLLGKIRAPSGLFAVLGNHETYAGVEKCLTALKDAGIWVLQDTNALIDDSLCLIGRKDLSSLRKGEKRRSLQDIMGDEYGDSPYPLILLDHQPFHLEEAEKAGVDLQLSGHCHAGQLFPFDLINKRMYEINWGTLRKGKTTIDVSSGAGTWGPPVRTAGRSEVVRIRVTFAPDEDK